MEIAQDATELLRPTACAGFRHPTCTVKTRHIALFFQHLTQCPSIDEIHHQVMFLLLKEEVAYTRNTGMIQVEQQGCLAAKPLDCLIEFGLILEIIQHFLDGTWPTEAGINGTVHGSHTTSSDQLLDTVTSSRKLRAWR